MGESAASGDLFGSLARRSGGSARARAELIPTTIHWTRAAGAAAGCGLAADERDLARSAGVFVRFQQ
jgi:hypothetical protein